ncbi:MAG TPA: hypothetical protein VI643_06125 [Planctomycetota bacterium]|nr:hypothetical protein [Planctomycetota bacterium]
MMKCASCPFHIDVTGVVPGTVVDCPACSTKVRVPTGNTMRVAAQTPAAPKPEAAPAPAPRRSPTTRRTDGDGHGPAIPRSTRMRHAAPKAGGGKMITFIVILAVAAIAGIFVVANMGGDSDDDEPKAPKVSKKPLEPKPQEPERPVEPPKEPEKPKEPEAPKEPEKPKEPEPPKEPEKPKGPEKIQIEVEGKKVDTLSAWAPGASEKLKKGLYPPEGVDPQVLEQAKGLLEAGRTDDLLKKAWLYYKPILQLCLDDDEKIALAAFEFFNKFCVLYKALNPETNKTYQVDVRLVTSPDNRGTLYLMFVGFMDLFTEHFGRHEKYGDPWAEPKKYEVTQFDWPTLIRDLKHFSKAKNPEREGPLVYDPEEGQGYKAFKKLEDMGQYKSDAYPYLIAYITSEDPAHRQAAIVALNHLTGMMKWKFSKNAQEAEKIQKEWMAALEIKELPNIPR